MNIEYHQLNLTNKNHEIIFLKNLQSKEYLIIGIEITDPTFNEFLHFNIDPQHQNAANFSITSLEFIFKSKDYINGISKQFKNILLVTVKPDLDSVAAMSILTMFFQHQFELNGDLILRLKSIVKSDKHGRGSWDNKKEDHLFFSNYSIFGLPVGLLTMVGDIDISISKKVKLMQQYLKTGSFNNLQKYSNKAKRKLKNASKDTSINIIIPNKFIFVESTYRGAIGLGYNYAPIVLGKNPIYVFGVKPNTLTGTKYTLAQFNDSYINLEKIKHELNKHEKGWGGSRSIIGSNQSKPSELNEKTIINIIKKQILEK